MLHSLIVRMPVLVALGASVADASGRIEGSPTDEQVQTARDALHETPFEIAWEFDADLEQVICNLGNPFIRTVEKNRRVRIHRSSILDTDLETLASTAGLPAEFVLHLDYIPPDSKSFSRAGLKHLGQLKNLRHLWVHHPKLADDWLAEIVALDRLLSLDMRGNQLTDDGLQQIGKLKQLTTLKISCSNITDAGLKQLTQLPDLKTLVLKSSQITDEGLIALRAFTQLTTLHLDSVKITDAGLQSISLLKSLTTLHLNSVSVEGTGLEELEPLDGLTTLKLTNARKLGGGLKGIAKLEGLSRLYLYGSPVIDADMTAIKELKSLRQLYLGLGSVVTDDGLRELKEMPHLRTLNVPSSNRTMAAISELKKVNRELKIVVPRER